MNRTALGHNSGGEGNKSSVHRLRSTGQLGIPFFAPIAENSGGAGYGENTGAQLRPRVFLDAYQTTYEGRFSISASQSSMDSLMQDSFAGA